MSRNSNRTRFPSGQEETGGISNATFARWSLLFILARCSRRSIELGSGPRLVTASSSPQPTSIYFLGNLLAIGGAGHATLPLVMRRLLHHPSFTVHHSGSVSCPQPSSAMQIPVHFTFLAFIFRVSEGGLLAAGWAGWWGRGAGRPAGGEVARRPSSRPPRRGSPPATGASPPKRPSTTE